MLLMSLILFFFVLLYKTLGSTYLADSIPSVVAVLDWEEDTASWYLISVCSTV